MSVGKERRERGKSCSNLEAARTGGKCIDTMAFAAARMILKDKRRKTSKEDFGGPRNRSKVISRRDFFSLLLLHSREKTTTIQPPKELRWMFNCGCFSFLFFFFFFSLQQTRQRKISKDKIFPACSLATQYTPCCVSSFYFPMCRTIFFFLHYTLNDNSKRTFTSIRMNLDVWWIESRMRGDRYLGY